MEKSGKGLKTMLIEFISITERLHRRFLTFLKAALEHLNIYDINASQAVMLCNMGSEVTSLRDLMTRGYYHGTNPTYNVQRLVNEGYLVREHRGRDRRATGVRLTEKGRRLRSELMALHRRQVEALIDYGLSRDELESASTTLHRLERFIMPVRELTSRSDAR